MEGQNRSLDRGCYLMGAQNCSPTVSLFSVHLGLSGTADNVIHLNWGPSLLVRFGFRFEAFEGGGGGFPDLEMRIA